MIEPKVVVIGGGTAPFWLCLPATNSLHYDSFLNIALIEEADAALTEIVGRGDKAIEEAGGKKRN